MDTDIGNIVSEAIYLEAKDRYKEQGCKGLNLMLNKIYEIKMEIDLAIGEKMKKIIEENKNEG